MLTRKQLAIAAALASLLITASVSHAQTAGSDFSTLIGVTPEGQTCLMGGSLRGVVAEPDVIVDFMKHNQSYKVVKLDKVVGDVVSIGAPEVPEPGGDCELGYLQELSFGSNQLGGFQLAVKGSKFDIEARLPKSVKDKAVAETGVHEAFVKEFLKKEGLEVSDVTIKQLFEVDFDGDGTPETVINALNTARSNVRKGEYSLVLVVRGDLANTKEKPQVIEVHKEISLKDESDPSLIVDQSVVSIYDIEGDGKKELVLYGAFAFGEGWQAYRIREKNAEQVLYCGCG